MCLAVLATRCSGAERIDMTVDPSDFTTEEMPDVVVIDPSDINADEMVVPDDDTD
jgi:hypothetical protein